MAKALFDSFDFRVPSEHDLFKVVLIHSGCVTFRASS
jgi:hypothetical protein